MKIASSPAELRRDGRRTCLAIGFFDGVHLGHQQVIRQTITDARQHDATAIALTFDRHPSTVVAPERTPRLIYTLEQRLEALELIGVDATLLVPFDRDFSRMKPEEFIAWLNDGLRRILSVCVGSSFTFGQKRLGNVSLLRRAGKQYGFTVHGLAAVALDGKTVSSTRIREAVRSGEFDAASQMLGRAYSLRGRVLEGNQRGRTLGFATANLETTGLVIPPNGVFAAKATPVGTDQSTAHRAVVNVGFRPTIDPDTPSPVVEAHLLDFDGSLYGHDLEITFLHRLRGERKFSSPEALKAQIRLDIIEAEKHF